MIPIIALALAPLGLLGPDAYVTGIAVVPVGDRTEVVVEVQGEITARDFTLEGPARLVLDLTGIGNATALNRRVERGGVRGIRVAQFSPTVARLVLDLEAPVDYEVSRSGGTIRISFANPASAFEPWSTGTVETAVTEPAAAQPDPSASAASDAASATAASTAASTTAAATAAPPPPPAPRQQQAGQRPPITVNFEEEPLASVLAAFADYAGRSIIASSDIKGHTITANVTNQDWEIALDAVLMANNLIAAEQPSGVILVRDASKLRERQSLEPLVARTFRVNYVSADSLVKAVEGLISSADGKAVANSSANSLIVTETETVLNRIEPMIRQLDVREVQVNISATIAFVDRTSLEQLGVQYDLKDSRGNQLNSLFPGEDPISAPGVAVDENLILLGGSSIAALGNANHPVPNPALEVLTSLVLGRHTLLTFLQALQSVTLSDIQARPNMTVMNHRQATIQVGQETPIRVIDVGTSGGATGQPPRATVDFKSTGVILNVTPHVTGEQVLLDMRAERSDAIPASSDIGVVFTTQNATTQVLVDDGETAVIGGLTITEKSVVRTGIPILMDIPVLGKLFRNTREQENKRDLLIMVTPHIIRN